MLLTSGSCTFIQKIRISKDQNYWKAFVLVYFVETTRANQSFEFLAGNSHRGRQRENAFLLTHWHVRNPNSVFIQTDRALHLLIRENLEDEFPRVEPVTLQSHCWEA